jgi:aspartate carbamoyltransferase catalytic subunit
VVQGLVTCGASVRLVGPPTLVPDAATSWGAEVSHDLDEVLAETDVLYLLRVQRERMQAQFFPSAREYARVWGADVDRVARLPEGAIVMHPGPMNRGVEISAAVADAPNSVIADQVTNGIAVRMSCLYLLLGGEE